MERVTVTLSKLEIAEIQLDRAISLFFNEKDFVSAITLAGAAEEILGKLLNNKNLKHSLEKIIETTIETSKNLLDENIQKNEVANLANYFRNHCKHLIDDESLYFSVDFEAADLINRASGNYFMLTSTETKGMIQFRESEYFPENWKTCK